MSQQRNPGAQDLSFESHHRILISAIHRIGLMLCNTVPHASGKFTLLLFRAQQMHEQNLLKCPPSQQHQKLNVAIMNCCNLPE